jgi:hypothetical protein
MTLTISTAKEINEAAQYLPKQENKRDSNNMETTAYNAWVYDPKAHDWINTINDENLTDYKPDLNLTDLLINRIDTELQ